MDDQLFLNQTFRLSKVRELCQFPIEVVSSITSLPVEKIQRLENGIESPSLPELELLSQAYQIPLPFLLGSPNSAEPHKITDPERTKAFIALRTRIIGEKKPARAIDHDRRIIGDDWHSGRRNRSLCVGNLSRSGAGVSSVLRKNGA